MNVEQTYNLNEIGYLQSQEQLNQQRTWAQEDSNKAYALQMIAAGVITPEYAAAAGMTVDEATTYYHNATGFVQQKRSDLSVFAGTDYVPSDEELAEANWTREQWNAINKAATPQKTYSGGGNPTKTSYTYGEMLSMIRSSSDPMGTYEQLIKYMTKEQMGDLENEAKKRNFELHPTVTGAYSARYRDENGNYVMGEFVYVKGLGSKTWQEVLDGVENGTIVETYDPETGTYTYTAKSKQE